MVAIDLAASGWRIAPMETIKWIISTAPEIFLLISIALGTFVGRLQFKGFSIGATACTLVVAVLLGQLGTFVIPPLFKSIFFSLFVFTIGYKSGPEFFASLSLRTLSQVGVALVIAATGLTLVLVFAFVFHLDPGTAAGLASGSLTQSSMIGTATSALSQLGLADDVLRQQQANIAAGYAVTYILGYTLTLLFVPFAAPWLMGIDLKEEAAKLEATFSGGKTRKAGSLGYQKFKARAYRVTAAAGQTVGALEDRIGQRVVVERIDRGGSDVDCSRATVLESGDEIVLAGPTAALVKAGASIGSEIEGAEVLREVFGDALGVLVSNQTLHDRTLSEIVDLVGDSTPLRRYCLPARTPSLFARRDLRLPRGSLYLVTTRCSARSIGIVGAASSAACCASSAAAATVSLRSSTAAAMQAMPCK
jgi:putative transport protein